MLWFNARAIKKKKKKKNNNDDDDDDDDDDDHNNNNTLCFGSRLITTDAEAHARLTELLHSVVVRSFLRVFLFMPVEARQDYASIDMGGGGGGGGVGRVGDTRLP